jgi:hypothetical protein
VDSSLATNGQEGEMATSDPRSYLFLLSRPNVPNRRLAYERARKLGLMVPAQYGDSAIVVRAEPPRAAALFESGLFSSYTQKTISDRHLEVVPDAQRRVIRMWNERFSEESRARRKLPAGAGEPWGSGKTPAPAPFSLLDVPALERKVERYLTDHKARRPFSPIWGKSRKINPDKLRSADLVFLESLYRNRLKDESLAYHLTRALMAMKKDTRRKFLDLSWLEELLKLLA